MTNNEQAGRPRLAVVTGGVRGIGLEITRTLRAEGYEVAAIFQKRGDGARACEAETGARTFMGDVADFESCKQAIEAVQAEMGTIDVLVNNAGITRDGMLHKMDLQNWHDVIQTNLTSCFHMMRLVIGGMREQGYGRIISISSINAQKGQFGQANYSASKAGIIGLTKAAALENAAKGVTVNAVCPGYIETDMTKAIRPDILESIVKEIPVGHMGQPQNIADIVAFLASERASYITGATFSANGGQYMV